MAEPTAEDIESWVAPLRVRIERDDPGFRVLATYAWTDMARARGATVESTTIHRHLEHHIADVVVNGVSYVLFTLRLKGWYHVLAAFESEFSRRSGPPSDVAL